MTAASEFTGTDGLIDPAVWPYRAGSLGLAWVEEVRGTAVRVSRGTTSAVDEIHAAWQGLQAPGVYESPEAGTLHGALNPVLAGGRRVADSCDQGARAIEDYAEELTSLEPRLRAVESEAQAFRSAVGCGVTVPVEDLPFVRVAGLAPPAGMSGFGAASAPIGATFETLDWREHRPSVEQHQELLARVAGVTEQIRQAEGVLVRRLQQPGGRRGRRTPDRIDTFAPASGLVMPAGGWFTTASDEELRRWWSTLAPWEREAAANAIAVMNLDSEAIGERIAGALGEARSGDPAERVATLDMLVQLFGQDRAAMEHAFLTVSATGVVAALAGTAGGRGPQEMGREHQQRQLRILAGLRGSLAEVSAHWDQSPDGAELAREFVSEPDLEDVAWFLRPELGYLFADQYDNPMGRELTLAMADRLDDLERGELEGPAVYREPPVARVRELLELGKPDGYASRINDPTARVLGTLGRYPDTALEWLSDSSGDEYSNTVGGVTPSTGEARMDYFYRVRGSEWSGDGFEGVAALWRGALEAEGGPFDPAASHAGAEGYDAQTWHDVAAVTTRAVRGLAENPVFIPENVSVLGSSELAGATALTLPHLADATVIEYNQDQAEGTPGQAPADTSERRRLPGVRGVYELPNVSRAAFGELIAGATATSKGTTALTEGAQTYQEALTALARQGVNPDRMIERNVVLQGMIDGAEHGGEAGVAERKDARAQRVIDATSSAVTSAATAPLPNAVGKIADGYTEKILTAAAKKLVTAGVDLGAETAADTWTGNLQAAQQQAGAETAGHREALGTTIDSFGRQLGVYPQVIDQWDQLTPEERGAGISEYRDRLLGFYDLAYNHQHNSASTGPHHETGN